MQFPFNKACGGCPADQSSCPGHRPLTCTCVRLGDNRFQCATCTLVCLDRVDVDGGQVYDGPDRFRTTLRFERFRPRPAATIMPTPDWIPVIDRPSAVGGVAHHEVVACSLKYVTGLFSQSRSVREKASTRLAHALTPVRGERILVANGKDKLLLQFWKNADHDFFERLLALGFRSLVGPGFSTYETTVDYVPTSVGVTVKRPIPYPEFMNALVPGRQLALLQMASLHGLSVVPILNYRNDFVARRWADLIMEHDAIGTVAIDFSSVKHGGPEFVRQINVHARLFDSLDKSINVYVLGGGERNYERCKEALAGPDVRLVPVSSRMAFQSFRVGRFLKITPDGVAWVESPFEKEVLYAKNIISANCYYRRR